MAWTVADLWLDQDLLASATTEWEAELTRRAPR
jgi:hypothetical protein